MNKVQTFCINALKLVVMLALIFIICASAIRINSGMKDIFLDKLLGIILVSCISGIIIINSKISRNIKILGLLLIALIIRLWWIFNVNSVPVSDFSSMYNIAKDLLNGEVASFRDFGYLSRFPHLICTTLYMAIMIAIFPVSHLFAIKIVNVILSVLSVFLLYKLTKYFIKNEKVRLIIVLFAAIFPAFISYSSTYCTENLAMPLYLLTMLCFFNGEKSQQIIKYFFAGVLLALSNMFRGVGLVFLIAFGIYIFVFENKNKIKKVTTLLGGLVFTSVFVSLFLISIGIIDKPLWKGAEPSFATLLLKGSNIENGGRWNFEDARFVDENLGNENLTRECFEIAFDRISNLTLTEKIMFFGEKFVTQWTVGDFSGTYWAAVETDKEFLQYNPPIFQIIYISILIFSVISVFNKNTSKETALLYTLLCGFGLLFMIIETQSRYSYIISWVFLILAVQGVENSINLFRRVRDEVKKV